MKNKFDYDLIVIGAGSGGVRAARFAANLGARVAIIEERFFGGTCVNVGCVPKKMFAYAAEATLVPELFASYGHNFEHKSFSWETLRDNKTREIQRLNNIYERLLTNAGVTIFNGHGKVEAPHKVSINEKDTYTTQHILLATGGKPYMPNIEGSENALISDDLFFLPIFPNKIAVIGGGYIATEFASILNGLGAETYQLYRGESLLRGFDQDVRNFITQRVEHSGTHLLLNTDVTAIHKSDEGKQLHFANGNTLLVDEVIFATGREPNVDNLLGKDLSIQYTQAGKVQTDDQFATSIKSVFAVGDLIEGPELTPVALEEGMWLARHLFDTPQAPLNYDMIPTAVFSHPSIGTIGLTEEEAREQHNKINIYRSEFRPLRYTLSELQERTLMKLVVDAETDRVLGLHMVGDDAGEITQGFAVAMLMGATKADFDTTIGIHPTSAEEFVTMRTPVE